MENIPVEKPKTYVYVYHKTRDRTKAEAECLGKLHKSARTRSGLMGLFKRGNPVPLRAIRTRRCDEPLAVYGNAEAVYTDDPKVKELYEAQKTPVHPITKKAK